MLERRVNRRHNIGLGGGVKNSIGNIVNNNVIAMYGVRLYP